MPLPVVTITAGPGDAPAVTVDGTAVPGVRSAQIVVSADHLPQVVLSLAAERVELDLPAGVAVLRAGPGAAEFADQLNPARLEGLALEHLELHDGTQGEAFAAAAALMAAEFDAARRG